MHLFLGSPALKANLALAMELVSILRIAPPGKLEFYLIIDPTEN